MKSRFVSILLVVAIALTPMSGYAGSSAIDGAGARICHLQGQHMMHVSASVATSDEEGVDESRCGELCAHLFHAIMVSPHGQALSLHFAWWSGTPQILLDAIAPPPNPPPRILSL